MSLHSYRLLVPLGVALLVATSTASAVVVPGTHITVGPVKGATYRGVVKGETITIKVAKNGRSATASIAGPPAFCSGGSGPVRHSSKPGQITRGGAFTGTIAFTSIATHKQFATVTVQGTFLEKFFQGVLKSSFKPAKSCNGQQSFKATKR